MTSGNFSISIPPARIRSVTSTKKKPPAAGGEFEYRQRFASVGDFDQHGDTVTRYNKIIGLIQECRVGVVRAALSPLVESRIPRQFGPEGVDNVCCSPAAGRKIQGAAISGLHLSTLCEQFFRDSCIKTKRPGGASDQHRNDRSME